MELRAARAVVTGGAGGIGRALAQELIRRGARVLIADVEPCLPAVAESLGAAAFCGDVAADAGVEALISTADAKLGGIDVFFANAGIAGTAGLGDEAAWDAVLDVNLRAHIRAARRLVPRWQTAGRGHFVTTASAAGLLTQLGQAGYSVTKHAALAFAEWLAVTYGETIGVTCAVPMGVDTPLLTGDPQAADAEQRLAQAAVTSAGAVLPPAQAAAAVLDAVEAGEFLCLPHPEVADMFAMKAADYDRWLAGMRRYRRTLEAGLTGPQIGAEDVR